MRALSFCVNCLFFLGGYGFVFVAQDTSTGKEYALKVRTATDLIYGKSC